MVYKDDYFQSVKLNPLLLALLIVGSGLISSCAYKWGFGERALPGGYKELAIPLFENQSSEVGLEVDFTRALIDRFNRSQVADVKEKDRAPVYLKGKILSIDVTRGLGASSITKLPERAVLSSAYVVSVTSELALYRESDQKLLWSSNFVRSKSYSAPRIGTPVVNSANATYNVSQRRETLRILAEESMQEAHDQMTESF